MPRSSIKAWTSSSKAGTFWISSMITILSSAEHSSRSREGDRFKFRNVSLWSKLYVRCCPNACRISQDFPVWRGPNRKQDFRLSSSIRSNVRAISMASLLCRGRRRLSLHVLPPPSMPKKAHGYSCNDGVDQNCHSLSAMFMRSARRRTLRKSHIVTGYLFSGGPNSVSAVSTMSRRIVASKRFAP
jgi:hypothetical protein